ALNIGSAEQISDQLSREALSDKHALGNTSRTCRKASQCPTTLSIAIARTEHAIIDSRNRLEIVTIASATVVMSYKRHAFVPHPRGVRLGLDSAAENYLKPAR